MAKLNKKQEIGYRINDEIRFDGDVRIVGENIASEVVPIKEAKIIAEKMELDLIEINPSTNPPIMRIGNYEKILYELKKHAKKNNKQQNQVKEIQLSVSISHHDLETKVKKAKEFISDGHKVKVVLTLKGREMTRKEENKRSILEFIVMMEDVAMMESNLIDNGNRVIVTLKKR